MAQASPSSRLELLTSWKEIASFLGKGVRTVQRWEATLGLPVIRPADGRSGIVMARPSDLEAWVLRGRQRFHPNNDGQQREDAEVRATFAGCVRDLRSCQAEVRILCEELEITRQALRREVETLKAHCREWVLIRGRGLDDERREPARSKVN